MSQGRPEDPFDEFYGEFRQRLQGDRWRPDVDIFETEKSVVVRAELAGVRRDDLRVTVDGDTLRISGVRLAPEPADVVRLQQMEIATGPFERHLRIALSFDRDSVTAHLSDGFLTVKLPKRARVERPIEVVREVDDE